MLKMPQRRSKSHAQEAAAASDLADIGEDISMEEVLGPGTHKKPVANEEAESSQGREPDGLEAVLGRASAVG